MKYKQLANQYKQEIEQLKQELERLRTGEEKSHAENGEEKNLNLEKSELNDTSLTLPEEIRKYHSPDENTLYSVTLWGGAHFEGERECMNENCLNKGKKIPVGELKFWRNNFGDGSWFFFCSSECETEVYKIWYAIAHPPANLNEDSMIK